MEKGLSEPVKSESKAWDQGIQGEIEERLRRVIDPETGLDVVRMGLVRDLRISKGKEGGGSDVSLVFRPSSPVCPLAFKLAWDIKQAVGEVPGVRDVRIQVTGYNRASELEALLAEEGDEQG